MLTINDYRKEITKIEKIVFDDYQKTYNFALFRANLFYLGWSQVLASDFILFQKLIQQQKMMNTHLYNFFEKECFYVENISILNDLWKNNNFIILSSFHQFANYAFVNYLVLNNIAIFILSTHKRMVELKEYISQSLTTAQKYRKIDSAINWIDIESYTSMKTLFNLKNTNKKSVLVTFLDGNHQIFHRNTNTYMLFQRVPIQQHIIKLAKRLSVPIVLYFCEFGKQHVQVQIVDYADFTRENLEQKLINRFCKSFEKYIHRENIYLWSYIMHLQQVIDKRKIQDPNQCIQSTTYDSNAIRFTEFEVAGKHYIFDSKYYLSYELDKAVNSLPTLKQKVLNSKIIL